MTPIAIRTTHLSKVYRLGSFSAGTLRADIQQWWARKTGREDPLAKIGAGNTDGGTGLVKSLDDVSFDIPSGTATAIIGKNGAGKSTLLKVLSRITAPSSGSVKIRGKVASLLEVGTGFHPDLSGRENVFLNGAIMGMRKAEIARQFDAIVDFSGVDKYIDTPVKRYSSGMYVRLAFAVAAHLDSDILIVDEVLAVGDAEFQRKCMGKMNEVSRRQGRTVLFVSHNMAAIQKLCTSTILLQGGKLVANGPTDDVIATYLRAGDVAQSAYDVPPPAVAETPGFICRIFVEDTQGNPYTEIPAGCPWQVRVLFRLLKPVKHCIIALGIANAHDVALRTAWSKEADLEPGWFEAVFREDSLLFAAGAYYLTLGLSSYERAIHYVENAAIVYISDVAVAGLDATIVRTSGTGLLLNPMRITVEQKSL